MPIDGYTAMFERMVNHPNIEVRLSTDYFDLDPGIGYERLVFTGPIDAFFDYRFGKLPYRSLDFRFETVPGPRVQPVGTINWPNEKDYTRVTDFSHLTGQECVLTTLCYEYPKAEGDPYYPVPRPENHALYKRYAALAEERPEVTFVGRLATYKYYNMDQVVAQALTTYASLTADDRTHRLLGA
jgi:UDP-galactopyranose mutase